MNFGHLRIDQGALNILFALLSVLLTLGLGSVLGVGSSNPQIPDPNTTVTTTPAGTTTPIEESETPVEETTAASEEPTPTTAVEETATTTVPAAEETTPSTSAEAEPSASTNEVTTTPEQTRSATESKAPSETATPTSEVVTPSQIPTPTESETSKPAAEIRQGNVLLIGDFQENKGLFSKCTLGYVHKESKIAITAGHCADGGHRPGTSVYMQYNEGDMVKIGTWKGTSDRYADTLGTEAEDKFAFINGDMGYIALEETAEVTIPESPNVMSGETMIHTLPAPGTEVCMFRSQANTVICGLMYQLQESYMIYNLSAVKGESGGPIWQKIGGFLGVISATSILTIDDKGVEKQIPVIWAAINGLADTLFNN